MPIQFDFFHSPSSNPEENEANEKYHARVVGNNSLDIDNIVNHIQQRCTLSKGDIIAVIGELSSEIANGLLDGKRVNIPEIGQFYLSLKSPQDANPERTHAQNVEVKGIKFVADKTLKEKVISNAKLERSHTTHSATLDLNEIDALLTQYFENHSFINRKKFEELCHLTERTALRHINRLLEEGRLINTNTKKNPIFELVKENSTTTDHHA